MVLRVIDIIKGTQLLCVDIVALMRNKTREKELLKQRREIRMCVMRTNGSGFVSFSLFFWRRFWQRGLARGRGQVGARIPSPGALAPSRGLRRACSRAAFVSRPKLEGSSDFRERFTCCPLHRCPSYPATHPSWETERLRACTEWVVEIESEV